MLALPFDSLITKATTLMDDQFVSPCEQPDIEAPRAHTVLNWLLLSYDGIGQTKKTVCDCLMESTKCLITVNCFKGSCSLPNVLVSCGYLFSAIPKVKEEIPKLESFG